MTVLKKQLNFHTLPYYLNILYMTNKMFHNSNYEMMIW